MYQKIKFTYLLQYKVKIIIYVQFNHIGQEIMMSKISPIPSLSLGTCGFNILEGTKERKNPLSLKFFILVATPSSGQNLLCTLGYPSRT